MITSIIKNVFPLNRRAEMSKVEYVAKKFSAFILIYFLSAVIGEGIIIGSLMALGYDPLHGDMPKGDAAILLSYYGFAVFATITIIYCKIFEKRTIKDLGLNKKVSNFLIGALYAAILLIIIVSISILANAIEYKSINQNIPIKSFVLFLIGFTIQSCTEEIMCRGFLLNSLRKKISLWPAIIISSTAFALPHFSSMTGSVEYVIVGTINMYLISFIFSMLVIEKENLWISCGLHSAWNFILYFVMGLTLSGGESQSTGIIILNIKDKSILNGGEFGVEASIITTVVYAIVFAVLFKKMKGKMDNGRIQ